MSRCAESPMMPVSRRLTRTNRQFAQDEHPEHKAHHLARSSGPLFMCQFTCTLARANQRAPLLASFMEIRFDSRDSFHLSLAIHPRYPCAPLKRSRKASTRTQRKTKKLKFSRQSRPNTRRPTRRKSFSPDCSTPRRRRGIASRRRASKSRLVQRERTTFRI